MSETFAALLAAHHARYPLLQPQDYVKLAWQAAFGPAHLLQIGEDEIQAQLMEEWQAVPLGSTPPDCEPVGGELVRFPLHAGQGTPEAVRLLARLLHATAQAHAADPDAFAAMLEQIAALPEPGIAAWIAEYRKKAVRLWGTARHIVRRISRTIACCAAIMPIILRCCWCCSGRQTRESLS